MSGVMDQMVSVYWNGHLRSSGEFVGGQGITKIREGIG